MAVDARRAAWWARAMAPGVRPVGGVLGVRPDGGWSTAAPRGSAEGGTQLRNGRPGAERELCGSCSEKLRELRGSCAEKLRELCGSCAEKLRKLCGKAAGGVRKSTPPVEVQFFS